MPGGSRWTRMAALAVVLLALGALLGPLAWWMAGGDLSENDARASVLSFVVGLCALLLAAAGVVRRWLGRRAESRSGPRTADPAVHAGYLAQTLLASAVKTGDALSRPQVLPLAWTGDGPDTLPSGGRVVERKLGGRLALGFREAARGLAEDYRRLRSGRLVVLGEPGAGKSVLAFMLVRGLLDAQPQQGRVPVLLPAASWDPTQERLDEWIVQTLAITYYSGDTEIPRLLHDHDLLLPVVDGLDEMPESARRGAVQAVNDALGRERPIVLTCRSAEYAELIGAGSPPLRRAAVVRIEPLEKDDVTAYLREVVWPKSVDPEPVCEHLDENPRSPLAAALSTPLMVSLLRTVCERQGELTGLFHLGSRAEVEDALVDAAVDAAYRREDESWEPGKARRWLTYLARHLHEHRERDLAWWRMSQRLLSPWAVTGLALGGGILLMLVTWAVMLVFGAAMSLNDTLRLGAFIGGGFAILAMISWYAGGAATPGRLAPTFAGSLGRLRRGLATGLALAAIPVLPVLVGIGAVISVAYGWPPENAAAYLSYLGMGLAVMAVTGLALAVYRWLDAPPTRSAEASPAGFLAEDRRASLVAALAAGAVLGLGAGPALIAGMVAAQIAQTLSSGWSGEPRLSDMARAAYPADWSGPLRIGAVVLLPGTAFALLTLSTRAWPRFVWMRFVLAARGRLPWRLMAFLEHAHRQGLLRQFGGVYQFRHVRMQEWLAGAPARTPQPPARRRPLRRALPATCAVLVVIVFALLVRALPADTSVKTLLTGDASRVAFGARPFLISQSGDMKAIRLWNVETGLRIGPVFRSEQSNGIHVGFTADARRAAISGPTAWSAILDTRTGAVICRVTAPDPYEDDSFYTEFSPDGTVLLTQTTLSRRVRLWNSRTCAPIGAPLTDRGVVDGMGFSPDSSVVYVTTDSGALRLWDTRTGARIDDGRLRHGRGTPSPRFTPTGDILVTTLDSQATQLVNPRTGRPMGTPLAAATRYVGEHQVRTTGDGRAYLIRWAADGDGIWVRQLWGSHTTRAFPGLNAYAVSDDATTLAGVNKKGEIRIWRLADGQQTGLIPTGSPGENAYLTFSPDGRTLAFRPPDASAAHLWDVADRRQLGTLSLEPGHWLWFVGGRVAVTSQRLSSADRQVLRTLNLDTGAVTPPSLPPYFSHELSAKQDRLAIISADQRTVDIWDIATGRRTAVLTGHTGDIHAVHFSDDDRLLATSSLDGTTRIWPMPPRG
ncbi:NACHT domain-containing protein [Nonomuraea sp. NPDC049152]|uniref:NACHT domain-containing protein n=1 Tax=Nonomuraea sp. NPDC049152 TaxID=3154350 RepID=UPI0033CC14B1